VFKKISMLIHKPTVAYSLITKNPQQPNQKKIYQMFPINFART